MKPIQKLLAIGAIAVMASLGSAQRVETGAFVRKPAATVKALIYQIENDPVVADRFMRHFHMSQSEVVGYLGGLHLARLKNDGSYRVFNVHADGVIRARVFELKAGTLVFADANGKPVLKKNCANPLTMGDISVVRDERTEPAPDVLIPAAEIEPSEALVAAELEQPPFVPMGQEVTPPQPITPVEARSSVGGAGGFMFIPLILVGTTTKNFFSTKTVVCPPVPEPATLATFALAPGLMYLRKRRRNKSA